MGLTKRRKKSFREKVKQSAGRAAASGLVMGMVLLLFVLALNLYHHTEETNQDPFGEKSLSEQAKSYQSAVQAQLAAHGKEQYVDIILALMMQESGGRGNDPMQASESLCGERGCIEDPDLSIEQGVSHFVWMLDKAEGDVKLALQAYNFGGGFIDFVQRNGGEYTEELAIEYSQEKYEELSSVMDFRCIREVSEEKEACYGDIKYVDAVLAYYDDARQFTDKDYELSLEE